MTDLKPGDRVECNRRFNNRLFSGTLLHIGNDIATVEPFDKPGTRRYASVSTLRKLPDDTPAPLPATVARPLALLVDDYWEVMAMMTNANSLGTCEL